MTRDMDLVRTLLLGMEDPQFDGVRQVRPDPHDGELGVTEANYAQVAYHPPCWLRRASLRACPAP